MKRILTDIEPYVDHEDLTMEFLRRILIEDFHVCRHTCPWSSTRYGMPTSSTRRIIKN